MGKQKSIGKEETKTLHFPIVFYEVNPNSGALQVVDYRLERIFWIFWVAKVQGVTQLYKSFILLFLNTQRDVADACHQMSNINNNGEAVIQ